MKRMLAFLLALSMVLSMAACGAPAQPQEKTDDTALQQDNTDQMDRQDKELVAELIGGTDASDLTDQELDALVDQLIGETEKEAGVVNLGNKQEAPKVEFTADPDAYDEDGAMKEPFDQVYPELLEQVKFSGESILIKLKSGKLTDGLKAAGIGALHEIVPMEKCSWYEAKLTEGTDPKEAIQAVRQLSEVLLAEYNYEIQTAALDDYKHFDKEQDEDFKKNGHNKDQWHFHYVGIPDGYEEMETEGGDPSVIVAVIDSGVDYTHEDLKDNMWVNTKEIPDNNIDDDKNGYIDDYYGVDIVAGKGNGDDTNGHGTHVAGIVAARNNNVGTLGVAYNVKIMSVKAAMHNGTLNQADIAEAVLYAYNHGAEVINMSFGGTACSIAVQDALATAYTRSVLVASAGNNGAYNEGMMALPNYPAALTYVLGVMSVDETGRESAFTNWDVFAYNGVEYELYAPGENIMSTLPGNQYGYLSGTSMAAPIVSSFAAILRSEFTDRDKYPTKFIYGQLASTSGYYADCLDPELHGLHNLPQIVNLNDALTKLPKPEVGVQDYALFDDPKYSSKNNGDGVIDAGETIALGLTLRNRWGMSENTLVTIDTKSTAGLDDPYITIQNPTVNYGSVGTYSTQDCGKVYTDELHTGWEDPFLITVSDDCPNDYRFTLNIKITCENALDEKDDTLYVFGEQPYPITLNENVRAGYILPSIIEEDMVLTKDNLYIIPNATVIQAGVTVRVEPGTHIQFWSDDANDPYASNYIAYLLVNGKFLVEGTKEEPVYIYPSQLMDHYGVEIGASSTGYVSMKYADVTNFFYYSDHTGTGNKINLADHCTFRMNYVKSLFYRSLSSGKVTSSSAYSISIGSITAKDSIFYKLGYTYTVTLMGSADRCIFVDCGLSLSNAARNCVFLGNSLVDQTNPSKYYNSSKGVSSSSAPTVDRVQYIPDTGSTYVTIKGHEESIRRFVAEYSKKKEIRYVTIENAEDAQRLCMYLLSSSGSGTVSLTVDAGLRYDEAKGEYVWNDGTGIDSALDPNGIMEKKGSVKPYLVFTRTAIYYSGLAIVSHYEYSCHLTTQKGQVMLFEIPGYVLPEDITFAEYAVEMDTGSTYQIQPQNTPVQLPADGFVYESTDENVLTVSETGLVTPVGKGTADVWVWSLDKAVRNRITFTVADYVPLESLTLPQKELELAVGETAAVKPVLTPANTTRKNVTYTSSDSAIAQVENGMLTAVGEGTATITATCEGFSDTLVVTAYTKATSLELSILTMTAALTDGTAALPQVITNEGADLNLIWRSTDETVATIENGKIVLMAEGTTSLIVTDHHSGLSAACLVLVSNTAVSAIRDMEHQTGRYLVLTENGDLYQWGSANRTTPTVIETDVLAFDYADSSTALVLKNDGIVYMLYNLSGATTAKKLVLDVAEWKPVAFAGYRVTSNGSLGAYFIRTENGSIYAWGDRNSNGQLGLGTVSTIDTPTLVNLDGVVDIVAESSATWFLTDRGEVYGAGRINSVDYLVPKLFASNAAQIFGANYFSKDGKWCCITSSGITEYTVDLSAMDEVALFSNGYYGVGIKDGKVYTFKSTSASVNQISGISDAVSVYTYQDTHYIVTESGLLYGLGKNSSNAMAGNTTDTEVTVPVLIPMVPLAQETVTVDADLEDGVLTSDSLKLTFNKVLTGVNTKLYADGMQVTVQLAIEDYQHVVVSRTAGFETGVSYELVFEAGTVKAAGGVTNTEEIRIPFTYAPEAAPEETPETTPEATPEETPEKEPVIYEAIVDESIQRILTPEQVASDIQAFIAETQHNPTFYGNAILNPISTDTNVEHWLRIQAPTVSVGTYSEVPLGGNYWGSTNQRAIELQMIDYADFPTNYARLMYAPYLIEAPENTFPFVTSVKLFNKKGEEVKTVGNEQVTFQVKFNRDMDTSIPLQVRFGSAYPYGDYEIAGKYVDARTWEGVYTLNTVIENGNQFFTISNGCSATEDLPLQIDQHRFGFVIDTTAAQALTMQGTATDTGVSLRWTQDDFDTLMGYNVYRATSEDGLYTRLNKTVIPAKTMEWFDDTVEPGKVYYYNFTVVQTDLAESEPSGKIAIMSKDTMAPNIYHSPVSSAFTGANLVLGATVTDNLNIAYANLYYRVAGTETWSTIRMNKLNDQYSAIIPASYITVAGVEYYIEAFDGVSYTYKGSVDAPYTVSVQQAIDANALGDVDGDGVITNLDALKLLYAINDKYNMKPEEFARADLNGDGQLWAAEALRILQYVSGAVGSVKM